MKTNNLLFAGGIILLIGALGAMVLFLEPQTTSDNLIRVACVGDSITWGFGYPETLQTKLGAEYNVNNFGSSASTVLTNSNKPYIEQITHQRSKAFQPSIVIIMLGTNDAQETTYESITNFSTDYKNLINEYLSLPNDPQIWLVKPPPIFENKNGWNNTILEEHVIPQIEQVANELNLPTIDVNSVLTNYPEYFEDGVHPSNEATTLITEEIYQTIMLTG